MTNLTKRRSSRSAIGLAVLSMLALVALAMLPAQPSRAGSSTPAATAAATQAATARPTPTFVPVPWTNRMIPKPKGDPLEGKLWMLPDDVVTRIAKDWGEIERNFLMLPAPLGSSSLWATYTYALVTPTPVGLPTPTPFAAGTTWRGYRPVKGTSDFQIYGCTRDGSACFVRRTWGQVAIGVYDTSGKLLRTEPSDIKSRVFEAEIRWDGVRWRIWNLDHTDEPLNATPAASG